MDRHDYAFPFRIDGSSRQAQQASYPAHVDQMIRQVLLTAPGERADMPAFGCGLRQLVFAPHSEALDASTKVLVLQALQQWLGTQINVQSVTVGSGGGDVAQLVIEIDYVLIETQTKEHIVVQVI